MLKGFRDFILRGNVIDLAVAVIIGAAFTGIVTALTEKIINPLLGAIVGKPNFGYLVGHVNGGEIRYGDFLTAIMNFLIIAAVVYFFLVLPTQYLLKNSIPPSAASHKALPPMPQRHSCRSHPLQVLHPARNGINPLLKSSSQPKLRAACSRAFSRLLQFCKTRTPAEVKSAPYVENYLTPKNLATTQDMPFHSGSRLTPSGDRK